MTSSLDFRTTGCSTDTHGRIWSECSLANPCPGATTHLRGDAEQSRVVAEPKVPAKHRLLARSAPLKYANWPGNNVLLSSSTAYPQGVGPVQCIRLYCFARRCRTWQPDPEIYFLLARELEVQPEECLVIEDSPAGVKAALAAGMNVIAVSTPLTRQRLHESGLLPPQHIVDDPELLPTVVAHVLAHHQRNQTKS